MSEVKRDWRTKTVHELLTPNKVTLAIDMVLEEMRYNSRVKKMMEAKKPITEEQRIKALNKNGIK